MFRAALGGRGQSQELVGRGRHGPSVAVGGEHDVGHGRPAFGDGAGLVEHDRLKRLSRLERGAVADQHAVLRALAGADHDRGRGRQAQGARTGDDQHGDRVDQGIVQGRLRSGEQPDDERHPGDRHDGRHEPARDQVGEAGDRRPRALGLLDEPHDLGERRLGADPRGPQGERAARVQRRADDLVAWSLHDGQRLAGEHRFVDGRGALDDDAVDRHLLTGSHAHDVVVADLGDRQVDLAAAAHHARRAGLQADERADGLAGLAFGARLEQAAEQDEGDDERGRVEVHRRAEAVVVEESGEEDSGGAVEVGGRRAQHDQRVHGGAAVARGRQRGAVELPADPELHRCGQRPQDPAVGEEGGHEGKPHAAQEHESRQDGADHDLAPQANVGGAAGESFGVVACVGCALASGALASGARARRALVSGAHSRAAGRLGYFVAGPPHGRHQVVAGRQAGHVLDRGLLGGQVHVGFDDAGDAPQRLLVARHAARARHAADDERRGRQGHLVAGLLDGGGEPADVNLRRVEGHRGLLGGEVDVGCADAGQPAQRLLVARHAARARHAADGDLDCRLLVCHLSSLIAPGRLAAARGGRPSHTPDGIIPDQNHRLLQLARRAPDRCASPIATGAAGGARRRRRPQAGTARLAVGWAPRDGEPRRARQQRGRGLICKAPPLSFGGFLSPRLVSVMPYRVRAFEVR